MTLTLPRWLLWLLGALVAMAASVCAVTLLVTPRRRPQESATSYQPDAGVVAQERIDQAHEDAAEKADEIQEVYDAPTDSEKRDAAARVGEKRRTGR